ncbi:MAG: hypothetical protein OJF52_002882 [Nitrospira sp.]|nr:MAG: hypothetical protein OJF52_002882 [Nitrospira sp.]
MEGQAEGREEREEAEGKEGREPVVCALPVHGEAIELW